MIHYSLKCADGHRFDSWFQSADAYEKLAKAGHVACAVCGSDAVEKALMAPRVTQTGSDAAPTKALRKPPGPAEQALAEMRAQIEANSDYVGDTFAKEARAMHLGELPTRPIWGEARGDEVRALVEDEIPVAPLPFTPSRKSN